MTMKRNAMAFWGAALLFLAAILLSSQLVANEYWFFAGYVILQFIVLSVAWSILGGYAGYVNFGTSAFFGVGVYTAVFLVSALGAPLRFFGKLECLPRLLGRMLRFERARLRRFGLRLELDRLLLQALVRCPKIGDRQTSVAERATSLTGV